jgi:pimeloyl-ACP methyl ester carboxylesterase
MAVSRFADAPAPAAVARRVDTGSVMLSVETIGEGPPLIMLHGFPEHRGAWRKVAQKLAATRRCILPDQRGYGSSDKPVGVADYHIDRLLEDIAGLADALGLERFVLAGHDWGGIVAWWFAIRNPQRLERLIIASAPHPLSFQRALINDPAQRQASAYVAMLSSPAAASVLMRDGVDGLWDRLFDNPARFDADERAETIAAWSQPGAIAAMLAWYGAAPFIVPDGSGAAMPAWTEAEDFTVCVPTLLLWGLRDTVLLPSLLDGLDELVPDLAVRTFADAGHGIIHERPHALAAAISEFLS